MNVSLHHHTHPLKDTTLTCLAWLIFCIILWALGLLLCEMIIERLYLR